jgi:hypothetical protein
VAAPGARSATAVPSPEGAAPQTPAQDDPDRRQVLVHARISGLSGLVFAALLVVALVLVRRAPGLGAPDSAYADFYRHTQGNVLVTAGLYVVPFCGVAFLWQMSTTRTLIGALPRSSPELQRWLHLASGVLFVCMLFAGSAAVGAVALLTVFSTAAVPAPDVARALTAVGYALVFVFGVRAAGIYMISTTTLARTVGLLPRWMALLSYLAAAFLLVSTTFHPAVLLVLPAWVLLFSVVVLLGAGRRRRPTTSRPAGRGTADGDGGETAITAPHIVARTPIPAQED